MTARDTPCPDRGRLRAFMLGELRDRDAAPLERHLATCARCNGIIDEFPAEDGVVAALRVRSEVLQDIDYGAVVPLIGRIRHIYVDTPGVDALTQTATAGPTVHAPRYDFLDAAEQPDELGRFAGYRVV